LHASDEEKYDRDNAIDNEKDGGTEVNDDDIDEFFGE